jgi:ABC-type amino acid transport substrate-binding protein
MKKSLLFFLIAHSLEGFSQTTELILASDVWPPFTNVEQEKSFAIDLVKEALNRINIRPSFEILLFDEVIAGIDAGKFDGSAALWISAERKKKYYFSSPYLQNQLVLVGRKGSDVSALSASELTGKRIGIVENYAYGDDNDAIKSIVFVKGKSDQENLERLLSGKIDYMLVDALLIQYLLKFQVNDVTEFLEIADKPILVKSLHFALRKETPEGKNIIARFDEQIKQMISDGTYHRILELNWIRTDVDGDGKLELVLDGKQAGIEEPTNSYDVFAGQTDRGQDDLNRYYIDGKLYNNWEDVPAEYKQKQLKGGAYDPNLAPQDYGLKLKF